MHDLIVIGAGIHGVAVAQAASEQGLRVLVLEQYAQPGLATSSKSSKLIHGGLRYLESGQFRLVRECLKERRHLLETWPDLVRLVPFHIPVYTTTSRRPWLIRLGLALYTLFSGKTFHSIRRAQWPQLDGLKTAGLQNVFQYYDAQTDDKKLTGRIMETAISQGAKCITGAHFESATCSDDGCKVHYRHEDQLYTAPCKLLINCAGPWVNEVLDRIQPRPGKRDMELVLGTHIVVPGKLEHGMYYLEAPQDRRAVFVMPWKDNTLIGTTESPATEPHNPAPPDADIDYLLAVHNHYFQRQLLRSHVLDAFAGLRVLPASDDHVFSRPRDTIIHHDQVPHPRVFSLYGGKLTSHRAAARQLLRVIRLYL